jgi:hypothetical protein
MDTPLGHTGTGNSAAAWSYATTSKSPTANRLQLIAVASARASGSIATPTVSGCNLTWVQVATQTYFGSLCRITLFRAMGASPTTGVLTIDFGGQTQDGASWQWCEVPNTDTGGADGSAAVVQSAVNNGSSTTPSVTLAAFADADNGTIGFFASRDNVGTWAVGTGFTQIGSAAGNYPRSLSEYNVGNDTTVDAGLTTGTPDFGAIAVEIKAADTALLNEGTDGATAADDATVVHAATGEGSDGVVASDDATVSVAAAGENELLAAGDDADEEIVFDGVPDEGLICSDSATAEVLQTITLVGAEGVECSDDATVEVTPAPGGEGELATYEQLRQFSLQLVDDILNYEQTNAHVLRILQDRKNVLEGLAE